MVVSYNEKQNKNKDHQTMKFLKALRKTKRKNSFRKNDVLIAFDGSLRRTTKRAEPYLGLQKNNLLLIEREEELAKKHHMDGVPCHHGTFNDFLSPEYDKIYSQDGSDFRTCRYIGMFCDFNDQVHTGGQSILKFIKNHKFIDEPVIASTFCKRVYKGKGTKGMYTFKSEFKTWKKDLKKLMRKKGYLIKKNRCEISYKGTGIKGDNTRKRAPMFHCKYSFSKTK